MAETHARLEAMLHHLTSGCRTRSALLSAWVESENLETRTSIKPAMASAPFHFHYATGPAIPAGGLTKKLVPCVQGRLLC